MGFIEGTGKVPGRAEEGSNRRRGSPHQAGVGVGMGLAWPQILRTAHLYLLYKI